MSVLKRIFNKTGKMTESDKRSAGKLNSEGRAVMPVALGMAGLNRLHGRPDSYVPLEDTDRVGEMASAAAAALAHEMDHGIAPSPFGTTTPDFSSDKPKSHNPNVRVNTTQTLEGVKEVVLDSNNGHGYLLNGMINGRRVKFLVDTGASQVSIPQQIANALGLERTGRSVNIRTANGLVIAYETELDEVMIGDMSLRFIPALINPGDPSDTILLGMSALRHLEFTHRDSKLILRQYEK